MKHLSLIIHENLKSDMSDFLRAIEQVPGFTFSSVEGHGRQSADDTLLSARDKVVGYAPRIRVDVLLEDHDVDFVLDALRGSKIGLSKHGIYWVTPVEASGRL